VNDTALKGTNAGVKKPAQKKKSKNNGSRHNQKAKLALQKMHAFCTSQSPAIDDTGLANKLRTVKAHRDDDEYKDMTFAEQQKVLGALVCVAQSTFKQQRD
jgi:hypothetical protein